MPPIEEIWREHKRFLIAVAAGLVAFSGGLSTIWSIDDGVERVALRNRTMEANIRELADLIAGREGHEAGVALTLARTLVPETRAAIEFAPRPAFALREGVSPFIVYSQAIEEVDRVRAEAQRRNVACPDDLGFVKDPPEERVGVHLAGADLAARVLSALVGAGVKAVESFRPGEAEYARVVEARKETQAPDGGAAAGAGDPRDDEPVLRRIPLRVVALCSIDALETLLSGFQRKGSSLELGALKVTRAGDGLLRSEIEFAALTLVPAAEARAAQPGAGAGGLRRTVPRAGGRLR